MLGLLGLPQAWSGSPAGPSGSSGVPGLAAAARAILGPDQGAYVQTAGGTVLLAQAAERAVHPASVSKIPTSLALLRRLGVDYRFVTTFASDGRVEGDTLTGDLVVHGEADPSLVDEDALLVAERLQSLGIRRVAGTLRVQGPLTFDWQSDPQGARLRSALSGSAPTAAWTSLRAVLLTTADNAGVGVRELAPAIQFGGGSAPAVTTAAYPVSGAAAHMLVINRSQPLLPLLKSLNDYSNNIFAPLAAAAGGAGAVQALARSLLPASMRSEITLGDGAGEDPRNRLSPRAAVRLLQALDRQLAADGHTLYDILPVAGVDDGTLRQRLNGPEDIGRVVGKTGTYGSYGASALVGALRTEDRGTVYFAILDHGLPVPEARRRQDRFVHALLKSLHAQPWSYQRDARPAVARAQVLIVALGKKS